MITGMILESKVKVKHITACIANLFHFLTEGVHIRHNDCIL